VTSRAKARPVVPLLVLAAACAAPLGDLACSKNDAIVGGDAAGTAGPGAHGAAPPPVSPSRPELTIDPADAPPAKLRLLDPGQPPRRKLRYSWRPGQRETLVMDLRTSASTEEGASKQPEIQLPPVHIVVAIDPQRTSPEGDLSFAWHVTSTSVTPDSQTPSSLTDGMRTEVAAIEHLSGTAAVTSRGISTRIAIDPEQWHQLDATSPLAVDSGFSPRVTGQMVEQVRQTLRDIAAPFPEEEVGAGARWEKLSQLASRDARVTQTEVFTLTQVTAATGALDDILAQTAPPQPLLSPGGASGTQARIESMLASGDGKTQFDLTRLVPQTKFAGTTTMVVSSRSGQEDDRRMTMIMRVEILLAGTVR
jgi:hypothetical protein